MTARTDIFVVDASVAVKWLIDEVGSVEAELLRWLPVRLVAPSVVTIEVGAALTKRVRQGALSPLDAEFLFRSVERRFSAIIPFELLFRSAVVIAAELDHHLFDCVYLAAAEVEGATMVTADAMFAAKVRSRAPRRAIALLDDVAARPPS